MISVTNGTARVAPSAAGHQADAKTAYAPIAPVHIIWHDCPEAVDAAYWRPACEAEGVTLEELRGGMSTGVDEDGNEIEITQEQTLQAMRSMGFWGFVDTTTRTIHAWADPATPDNAIMEFLGHEIGHITGQPDASDWEEEMRADQYGSLVKMAHSLLLTRPAAPAAPAVDADRELLAQAAKAAGYKVHSKDGRAPGIYIVLNERVTHWNPLHDDGDVFRLAVTRNIVVSQCPNTVQAGYGRPRRYLHVSLNTAGGDRLAATRRAIVSAAAEIGGAA